MEHLSGADGTKCFSKKVSDKKGIRHKTQTLLDGRIKKQNSQKINKGKSKRAGPELLLKSVHTLIDGIGFQDL